MGRRHPAPDSREASVYADGRHDEPDADRSPAGPAEAEPVDSANGSPAG